MWNTSKKLPSEKKTPMYQTGPQSSEPTKAKVKSAPEQSTRSERKPEAHDEMPREAYRVGVASDVPPEPSAAACNAAREAQKSANGSTVRTCY
ncbi:hypothetical protein MRX96_020483 [Rhipicephalus microplus]